MITPRARGYHRGRVPELNTAEQYSALLRIAESITLHRDLAGLLHDIAEPLHRVVRFDFLSLILHEPERGSMRLHILESPGAGSRGPGLRIPRR